MGEVLASRVLGLSPGSIEVRADRLGAGDAISLRQVRVCLNHLHDLPFLESHPLAALFAGAHIGHLAGGRHLRNALIEAVDALRPSTENASGSRTERRFLALKHRYVNGEDVAEVCATLNISQSEFYRVIREALEAVVTLLQESFFSAEASSHAQLSRAKMAAPQTGRQRELGRLLSEFEAVQEGNGGRTIIIEGASGVGKSRLIKEFLASVENRGAVCLLGRWFQEDAEPYNAWIEALAPEVRKLSAISLRDLQTSNPGIPELFGLRRQMTPANLPYETTQEQQGRLYDGVVHLLRILSARSPLVLALDDLQWAPSLDLFSHVTRRLKSLDVLIVAAMRTQDANARDPLNTEVARRLDGRQASFLPLHSLAKPDADMLLCELLKGQPQPRLCDVVFQRSQGNPFFIEELVRALWESDLVFKEGTGWDISEASALPVPSTIKAVLAERIGRLSSNGRELLLTASVLGERFNAGLLQSLSGFEEDLVLLCIEEALAADLLVDESADSDETYRFTDPLVRGMLYDAIPGPSRRKLHRKACGAIKVFYDGDLEGHTQELVRHYQQASELRSGGDYAYRSGEKAEAVYAWGSAVKWYEMALTLWRTSEGTKRQQAEVLLRLGRVYCQSTLNLSKAIEVLERALFLFKERGERRDVAAVHLELGRALQVSSAIQQSNLEQSAVHLHAARSVLEKLPTTWELAEVYQSLCRVHARLGDLAESSMWAHKAKATGEQLQSPDIVTQALRSIAGRLMAQGQIEEGLAKYEEAWGIAIDKSLSLEADTLRGSASLVIGVQLKNPTLGLKWAQREPTFGTVQDTLSVPTRLVSIYTLLGDFKSADRIDEELQTRLLAAGQPIYGQSPSHRGLLLLRSGAWGEALAFLRDGLAWAQARQYFTPAIETIPVLSDALVATGQLAEAEEYLRSGFAMAQTTPSSLHLARIVPRVCELYLSRGKIHEAAALLNEYGWLPRQLAEFGGVAAEFYMAAGHYRARTSDLSRAESEFRLALAANVRFSLPWDEAYVYAQCTDALRETGNASWANLVTLAYERWADIGACEYAKKWLAQRDLREPVHSARGATDPLNLHLHR